MVRSELGPEQKQVRRLGNQRFVGFYANCPTTEQIAIDLPCVLCFKQQSFVLGQKFVTQVVLSLGKNVLLSFVFRFWRERAYFQSFFCKTLPFPSSLPSNVFSEVEFSNEKAIFCKINVELFYKHIQIQCSRRYPLFYNSVSFILR